MRTFRKSRTNNKYPSAIRNIEGISYHLIASFEDKISAEKIVSERKDKDGVILKIRKYTTQYGVYEKD